MSEYEEAKASLEYEAISENGEIKFTLAGWQLFHDKIADFIQAADKEIATKDAELARLREELEAWKKRFPAAGYDGSEIVLSG